MEETNPSRIHLSTKEDKEEEWVNQVQYLLQTLPKERNYNGICLNLFEGFWCQQYALKGLLFLKKYYKPHKTDIIIASTPKSGTTWLKALAFTVVNRSRYSLKNTPLLTTTIHELIPFFEFGLCQNDHFPDLDRYTEPRIFATHASYSSLPCSVKDSENRILYICRNPFDQFISHWHFSAKVPSASELLPIEEAFEKFCQGVHSSGPLLDNVLGYWKASIERPEKLLFLKYEDLKEDNVAYVKKIAAFLGFPFSEEEEKQGLIQEISKFCGFENMKDFDVNKNGNFSGVPNTAFFRKGEVGDYFNYFTPNMVERIEKLFLEKMGQFGLSFSLSGRFQSGHS